MRCFGVIISASLAACAVGPEPVPPVLDAPATYRTVPPFGGKQGPWWEGFGDPVLVGLVAEAQAENLELAIAQARLSQASALARAERADLFPRADGFADGTVRTALTSTDPSRADDAAGGFLFGWVPDVFGGRRRELQAARATALARGRDLADVRRLVIAGVADTYVELRRTDARLALLETSLDLQNRTLEIVQLRADAGLGADLDVQRALADLAQTRAQRGPLIASRLAADAALAVLTGRTADTQRVAPNEEAVIPAYTDGPPVGVPADLLRARPDIQASEAQLVAAIAVIGAETADLYPSLSLPGSVRADLASSDIAGSAVAAVSAIIDVPLFDAGRRRAEIRAARANADAALAAYRLTLLEALREVEVALARIDAANARRDDLAIAVEASEAAFVQLQALYTEGLATLIEVLDSQRQLISSREAFVDSEAALAAAIVALYRSVGGTAG